MGRQHELEQEDTMKTQSKSLKTKAAHFVSDLTTVLLNPISDKPSKPRQPPPPPHVNSSSTFVFWEVRLSHLVLFLYVYFFL